MKESLKIAPESTVVVSSAARSEHTVERVANLALLNMNSIRTPINSILSKKKSDIIDQFQFRSWVIFRTPPRYIHSPTQPRT